MRTRNRLSPPQARPVLPPLELLRIVPLAQAAKLAGVSDSTLRLRYRNKLVRRGGKLGMRLGDALGLIEPPAPTVT